MNDSLAIVVIIIRLEGVKLYDILINYMLNYMLNSMCIICSDESLSCQYEKLHDRTPKH